MPSTSVKLVTTNKVIGYKEPDNVISWSFTPVASFAPGKSGTIKLYMPYLYQIGLASVMPYNPKAINQCTSDCFSVKTSALLGQHIEVTYSNMKDSCLQKALVTI
jgi:hypothetical protein